MGLELVHSLVCPGEGGMGGRQVAAAEAVRGVRILFLITQE